MHPNDTTQQTSVKLCECGCGQPAPIAKKTSIKYGHVKGEPMRFIHGHYARTTRSPRITPSPRPSLAQRFWSKVDKRGQDDCWEWQAGKVVGYGEIWNNGRMTKAHRVSYELRYGPIQGDAHVLHKCDNPGCVNPDHLFLGTIADNNADRDQKGRQKTHRGEQNYRAKFTDDIVRSIRVRHANGASLSALAREYGVNKTAIHKVVIRESWRHID